MQGNSFLIYLVGNHIKLFTRFEIQFYAKKVDNQEMSLMRNIVYRVVAVYIH